MSPDERARKIALMDAGVTTRQVFDDLQARGVEVSYPTVSAVIRGTFRNDDVIEAFCRLTGTKRAAMFPPQAKAS